MTKAKKKTTGRPLDAEDALNNAIDRACALIAVCAAAANSHECDSGQLHLALESARDILETAYPPLDEIRSALDQAYIAPANQPPEPDKPLDKAMAKKIIARVKAATKPAPAKKRAANGANGTQMPGEQSLDFGGGAQ